MMIKMSDSNYFQNKTRNSPLRNKPENKDKDEQVQNNTDGM